jgi:Pyruvate/2-oxoacid:ferredoxin oxidoreductase gamma subunit
MSFLQATKRHRSYDGCKHGGLALANARFAFNGTTGVVADDLVTPLPYQRADEVAAASGSYPQAMVVCENCGNTVYLNAVMIGVMQGE